MTTSEQFSEYPYTTADLAREFGISVKTFRKDAAALGLGIEFGGRAGFRYSAEDRRKFIESKRPAEPTPRRRRRAA